MNPMETHLNEIGNRQQLINQPICLWAMFVFPNETID
jgi:hypothetical protein